VASSYSGTNNSNKLKNTLSELESALSDWDKIPVASDQQTNADSEANSFKRKTPPSPEIPDEMKRRTKELLDRLKQQIDEL
jgi:hypothetical protein